MEKHYTFILIYKKEVMQRLCIKTTCFLTNVQYKLDFYFIIFSVVCLSVAKPV